MRNISQFVFLNFTLHLLFSTRFLADAAKFSATGRQTLTDEERLNDIIFRNYDPSFRPVYNASEPVEIIFGLNLITVSKMDEIGQVLELTVWLEMYWKDKRLTWAPSDFSGLEMVRLPAKLLWTPDIVLYNSADEFRMSGDVRAMVAHTGEIFAGPYVKLRSTCILDLTWYPFDEQLCRLIFGSWSYDMSQLVVVPNSPTPVLTQYIESAVWDLSDSRIEETRHTHSCCPHPFSDIVVSVRIRRRFLFNNLLNIFIPTCWLSFLAVLTFWLDPASGEKITLCVTILVTFTLFQLLVVENTPRTSDFMPLISLYLETSYLTAAIVCGIQVFVLNLHGLSPILIAVPHWLRVLVLNCMAPALCISVDLKVGSPYAATTKPTTTKKASSKGKKLNKFVRTCTRGGSLMISSPTMVPPTIYEEPSFEANQPPKPLPGPANGDDNSSDSSTTQMQIKEQENEHIYMGIEEILDELQPKTHQRFLQREVMAASYQSLTKATRNPVIILSDDSNSSATDSSDDEKWKTLKRSNVTFSVRAPPPSPMVPGRGERQFIPIQNRQRRENEYQALKEAITKECGSLKTGKQSTFTSKKSSKGPPRQPSSDGGTYSRPMTARSRFEQELLHRLLRSVGYMIKREQSTKMSELVVAEWRMIAFVVDRLAFWFFAIFTLSFILIFLVAMPLREHAIHKHNGSTLLRGNADGQQGPTVVSSE